MAVRTTGAKVFPTALAAGVLIAIGLSLVFSVSWASQSPPVHAPQLTETEQRGRQIYLKGTSPSGIDIIAVLGTGETQVPAATLACGNCHGLGGLGIPEGGVSPSDLRWESLTRPYEVTTPSGRKHGPYADSTLKRAVTMGLDPAGNTLEGAMPRFRMSLDDANALVAYIKKLGHTLDPGLTDTSILIATIAPPAGPLTDTGKAVVAALQAYLDDLNDRGGLYGRRLVLRVATTLTKAGVRAFIRDENVFAVISPIVAGSEKELLPLFEEDQIPLIGPLTYLPRLGYPVNRHIFYLYTGLDGQARALCQFAAKKLNATGVALVVPAQGLAAGLPAVVRERCSVLNLKLVADIALAGDHFDASRLVRQLSGAGAATIIFLGSADQSVQLASAAARIGWRPNLLLIGSLEGQQLFDVAGSFQGKTFVAYPTLPSDWSPDRMKLFAAMAESHHLSTNHMASQISALSSAEILIEGLRRAGKDLSREKLVDQLEGLYDYDTGLTPGITYGPNRRVGALGAYVVLLDPVNKRLESAGWIPLN